MPLKQDISAWDGKAASVITTIYQQYHTQSRFISSVINLLDNSHTQPGASWLLKHHLETGASLKPNHIQKIFTALPTLRDWQSQLHLLQCMPYMTISNSEKKTVEHFLRDCLESDNKFVRAWAYNGFYELAKAFPAYRAETKSFLDMAMRDEAASVKARIRNILKQADIF